MNTLDIESVYKFHVKWLFDVTRKPQLFVMTGNEVIRSNCSQSLSIGLLWLVWHIVPVSVRYTDCTRTRMLGFNPPSLCLSLLGCVNWYPLFYRFSITADSQSFCHVSSLAVQPGWPSRRPPSLHLLSWLSILDTQRRWCGWPCRVLPLALQAPKWKNKIERVKCVHFIAYPPLLSKEHLKSILESKTALPVSFWQVPFACAHHFGDPFCYLQG